MSNCHRRRSPLGWRPSLSSSFLPSLERVGSVGSHARCPEQCLSRALVNGLPARAVKGLKRTRVVKLDPNTGVHQFFLLESRGPLATGRFLQRGRVKYPPTWRQISLLSVSETSRLTRPRPPSETVYCPRPVQDIKMSKTSLSENVRDVDVRDMDMSETSLSALSETLSETQVSETCAWKNYANS